MSCGVCRTKSALKITCYVAQDREENRAAEEDRETLGSMAPREFQDQWDQREIREYREKWDYRDQEAPKERRVRRARKEDRFRPLCLSRFHLKRQ